MVLGLLSWAIASSPGWSSVRQSYFDPAEARLALPEVAEAFVFNVRLFLVAEVAILAVALVVAVVRVLPSPALMPLKLVAVVYTDVFRGTPTLLVVFLVGFGFPALRLEGVPTSYFTLGLIALTLSYGGVCGSSPPIRASASWVNCCLAGRRVGSEPSGRQSSPSVT